MKWFFYTPRYSYWDMIPVAAISAGIQHDNWTLVGVAFAISVAINVVIHLRYNKT